MLQPPVLVAMQAGDLWHHTAFPFPVCVSEPRQLYYCQRRGMDLVSLWFCYGHSRARTHMRPGTHSGTHTQSILQQVYCVTLGAAV